MSLRLPCFEIVINENTITSGLHEEGEPPQYEAAMDAIESMVLAHHCAGVDVTSPQYLEGIETAVQACAMNIDEDDL